MNRRLILLVGVLSFAPLAPVLADGPADNLADQVRRIPKVGIDVPEQDRERLEEALERVELKLKKLRASRSAVVQRYLPDAEVLYWAVDTAFRYVEFFHEREIPFAHQLIAEAEQRIDSLSQGNAPWTKQVGAVIRGYRSRIDHSIQPYAVYVPEEYLFPGEKSYRCDLWYHGRGETLSELSFIQQRMRGQGAVSSQTHFMVHPYGRYSNANKFAGEVDTFEVLDHLRSEYRIDDDRIAVRGFSMGGAACWQFAVHYADHWFAATPGAGFSETPEFLRTFQQEELNPTEYERKLWSLYNCTDHALNLFHVPTIAYSGEVDRQKQAADIMAEYLEREGIDLVHIIGPQTAHKIHPDSLSEIEDRLTQLEKSGRQTTPREVHFTTYTLKYNRMHWVRVDALEEHWKKARVDAFVSGPSQLDVTTHNVRDLSLQMSAGAAPFGLLAPVRVSLDGQVFDGPRPRSDRSWGAAFHRDGATWRIGRRPEGGLQKKHGLQGPIDDAFMDSFLFVEPTGDSAQPRFAKWSQAEFAHAVEHWRRHFRGHPRVKRDTDITPDDIASANLVLFGDPRSNVILGQIAEKLPITWADDVIQAGEWSFSTAEHALVMIYPNPLNPNRYVVLNSGFTFREYDYLNNARQVPKLPDWAVIDLKTPISSRAPGEIVAADFFDESWKLKPTR